MDIEKIKSDLELLEKARQKIKDNVRSYCQDKSNDLKERWELFNQCDLGESSSWIERFDCKIGEDIIYNCEERHRSYDTTKVLECIDLEKYSNEDLIEYKENVLSAFIKEWTLDW